MEEFSRELPDLGGAAVRGEAVAESDLTTIKCPSCNGHGLIGGHSGQTPESYEEHSEGCDDCDGQGKIIVSKSDLAAFVSARAADAPSEPSEHTFNSLGISENWSVTVEANGESILCISNQHVAGIAEPGLDAMVSTIESAALHLLGFIGKSRAADALDSQPTEWEMADTKRLDWLLPNLHPANFGFDFDGGYEWASEEEFLYKFRRALDSAMGEQLASSQPTDGGVRNGQLMRFYAVDSMQALIDAQEEHISKLQAKLPRNTQPAFTRVREG